MYTDSTSTWAAGAFPSAWLRLLAIHLIANLLATKKGTKGQCLRLS